MKVFKKLTKRSSFELYLHFPFKKTSSRSVNTIGMTFLTYINWHWNTDEGGKFYQLDFVVLGLGFSISLRLLKKGLKFYEKK